MSEHKQTDFSKNIMAEIKQRGVRMHPHIYFVVVAILLGVGAAAAFFAAFIFIMRLVVEFTVISPFAFLRFGGPGFIPFIESFPWISLAVAATGLGGGLYLLRKYDFSYKQNFLPVTVVVVATLTLSGMYIGTLAVRANVHRQHAFAPFFHPPHVLEHSWVLGEIQEVTGTTAHIMTPHGDIVEVQFDNDRDLDDVATGDMIRAIGARHGNTFKLRAFGKESPIPYAVHHPKAVK